jgi:HSP20 family protein
MEAKMTARTTTKDLVPALQRSARIMFTPLQRELNRFFDDLGDGFAAYTETHFAPRMDVRETEEGLQVSAEVPGLKSDQIKVTAEDDVLTISGEKQESSDKTEGAVHVSERSYGQFSRSIYLPRSVDPAKISASMKDGVLTVSVPRRAGADTKAIEIQSR